MKAILTKYLGPTNYRGARIKAYDSDGNSATIPFPYELNTEGRHRKAAEALLDKMGWEGNLAGGHTKEGMAFVFVE